MRPVHCPQDFGDINVVEHAMCKLPVCTQASKLGIEQDGVQP